MNPLGSFDSKRLSVLLALSILVFQAFSHLLVVPLILQAHRGESSPFFNSMVRNHDAQSLEIYLIIWRNIQLRLSMVLLGAAIGLAIISWSSPFRAIVRELNSPQTGSPRALSKQQTIINIGAILLAAIAAAASLCFLDIAFPNVPIGLFLLGEDGLIENATLTLIVIAAVLTAKKMIQSRHDKLSFALVLFFLCIYAGREMDLRMFIYLGHPKKWWDAITRTPSPLSAWLAPLVLLTLPVALYFLLRSADWSALFKNRPRWAVYILASLSLLASSQLIDNSKLELMLHPSLFEETLELFAAASCLAAACHYSGLKHPAAPPPSCATTAHRAGGVPSAN